MRKVLPVVSLLGGILFVTTPVQAQFDRFAYAITDVQNETTSSNWNFLRKLNLQTGEYSPVLLQGNDASLLAYDAVTKKQLSAQLNDERYGKKINAAFATGVAAMAFDKKNNRLYYTPMFIDQLRYVDLKTLKVYFLTGQGFTGMSQKNADQGNIVTRMVIASDGNGYAMTNDGTHLIKFTTGKKILVTELGPMVDAQANKGISVHNSCSSFGGDMVADDDGNLYVFSARNEVFKINIETKVATHLATLSGLPANFTVNGAAVNTNNQIIVASALDASSCFTVDPKTWTAAAFKITGTVWHSSDLANSNLLVSGNKPTTTSTLLSPSVPGNTGDGKIQIYPNPVTNYKFIIEFNQLNAGKYTLQVTDVMGLKVLQQVVSISGESQSQNVNLNPSLTKGIYLLKVTNQDSRAVFSTKLVVQ